MTLGTLNAKISRPQLVAWSIGFLMPLWLVVIDLMMQRLTGIEVSGAWLYVSVTVAAIICAITVVFSRFTLWQRVALIMTSWLLLVCEVLVLAAAALMRNGLEGVL